MRFLFFFHQFICVSVWAHHAQNMSNTSFVQACVISGNRCHSSPRIEFITKINAAGPPPAKMNKVFVPAEMVPSRPRTYFRQVKLFEAIITKYISVTVTVHIIWRDQLEFDNCCSNRFFLGGGRYQ